MSIQRTHRHNEMVNQKIANQNQTKLKKKKKMLKKNAH